MSLARSVYGVDVESLVIGDTVMIQPRRDDEGFEAEIIDVIDMVRVAGAVTPDDLTGLGGTINPTDETYVLDVEIEEDGARVRRIFTAIWVSAIISPQAAA